MSRGHDGTVVPLNKHLPPPTMQGIVIGGVANGVLLQSLLLDADVIELGRPTHAKPLTSSSPSEDIAMAHETDVYSVNTFYLPGEGIQPVPFALCIVNGKTAAWAMTQLVKGFVIQATEELKKETILQ
jgi:hypothetical protein